VSGELNMGFDPGRPDAQPVVYSTDGHGRITIYENPHHPLLKWREDGRPAETVKPGA
jgi:hypothetical protein